jgi:hypothetical protein
MLNLSVGPNFQGFELQMYFEVLDHVFLLANLEQYHKCILLQLSYRLVLTLTLH